VVKITVACVDEPGRRVIEIGPGLGTLTSALLSAGATLTAVERDRDMCHILRQEISEDAEFTLVEDDAAKFDYDACLEGEPGVIVGNLPYQITGRIIRRILESKGHILRAVFMVQEEVADRLHATTEDKARGALSVMVQVRCETRVLFRLPPTAFFPKPRVRSAVIVLTPRQPDLLDGVDGNLFDRVVKAAFATRRKTIRNSMLTAGFAGPQRLDRLLAATSLDPGVRAEKVHVNDFVALAKAAAQDRD